MAVDMLSENSNSSPRISFSRDFCQSDVIPIEQRPLRPLSSNPSSLNSSFDFDLCFTGDDESWSADELFSGGKIVPTDIKKKPEPEKRKKDRSETGRKETGLFEPNKNQMGRLETVKKHTGRREPVALKPGSSSTQMKQLVMRDETGDDDEVVANVEEKSNTKSFWSFKRSSSLNCGRGYRRSLCPLPLLSRSNSTGSTPNLSVKQKQSSKNQQEHIKRFQSFSSSSSSSSSSSRNNSKHNNYQKPPLKKSYGGYGYGNDVRIPILNVASGNLFGLGSIFSGGGRYKNKKR